MSVDLLELSASLLGGELLDEVTFVGGATTTLWVTDSGAPEPRPTDDVDVIVEVHTHAELAALETRLRARGFEPDEESGVICRHRHSPTGLVLDVMPTDARLLGFSNRWYADAVATAQTPELPSGQRIRAVDPVHFIATKLEAFGDRGGGDYLGHRDFHDVIVLIDGREEIVEEVRHAAKDLRTYIAGELRRMSTDGRFDDGAAAALRPDDASQARLGLIVLPRIAELIASAEP